jgi:cytochrome c oxidase subunit 3
MNYEKELSPEVREKMKKNLVYVGIFSIVMLFAGFTSAYIVMMGDSFWLKYPMPKGFWLSSVSIALSSLTFILAIKAIKKGNQSQLKLFMSTTVLLGLFFVYFQFRGYNELVSRGINPVNNHILVTDGRYGDYFEVRYKGNLIQVDGNRYLIKGREMSESEFSEYQKFMKQFEKIQQNKPITLKNIDPDFELIFQSEPVLIKNKRLFKNDSTQLDYSDEIRLNYLALHARDKRGDFFVRGEMGKDFHLYFKGKELQYKDRNLVYNGRILEPYLQIKAMETADTASSFLYLISFLHILHVAVALIYLLRLTIHSFSGKFSASENLSLRVGGIFWHFLGLLWAYLLLFLIFIH